jgi:hypothetical protein
MTISAGAFPTRPDAGGGALGRLLASLLFVGAAAAPAAVREAQSPSDLAGLWELDPEASDDPAEVMQRAMSEADEGRGRRGRRVGGRGFAGRGSAGPGAGGPGGMERRGAGGARGGSPLMSLPDLLEIESGRGELRLVLEERVQILYLDGEEHAREDGRGGRITTVAEFRGGIARIREVRESRMGKLEVVRTLQTTEDVLVVRTELKMPRRRDPVLLRSVYRRID